MTQQAPDQLSKQSVKLLVVEDDPDIQSVLQDLFVMADYEVIVVATGAMALDALERESVDLVVLDVMLPDVNGYELCEQVRHSTLSSVPILMLTALTQPRNVTMGLQAGADDYVKKPFASDELLLRVKTLLRRQQQARTAEHEAAALRDTLALVQRQLTTVQGEAQIEMTLRREFLHNVTTHMRALYGIVDATIRKLPPSVEREAVQQLRSRVRGAALVYEVSEALQHDPVEIGALIRTIASALKSMYRPWKRVPLTVTGGALEMPVAIASPLAMIVNELVTNCFKHAFPENRFGAIDISYAEQDSAFVLDIRDDGVGLAVDQRGGGRGRATVTQLIEALNGTIDWQSGAAGTHVHIAIPLHPAVVSTMDEQQESGGRKG